MEKRELSPEQRDKRKKALKITGLVFLVLFAAATVLSFVFAKDIDAFVASHTDDTIFGKIIGKSTSLIFSVQTLFVVLLVLYVLGLIYSRVFRGSPRRVTIGKLVSAITKVVVWLVGVLVILAMWGVDVGALITGAGFLTLIVGLGMQSLIADVVAGIFLVSDGTLQVGDIVVIDGWRGTVQEIGFRNTRLINYSGDVRVANNSTIKVYVNQSRANSYPTVKVGVDYGEDLDRVRAVFEANKDAIREKIPAIVSGPDYLNVDTLDSSSVVLLFGATCKEENFVQVQRDLNC